MVSVKETSNKKKSFRRQSKPSSIVAYAMLLLGVASLASSIYTASHISAFIGLGLCLWGALLLYIAPTKHVQLQLLNSTVMPALRNIERMLADVESPANGIYLPPAYLKDFESSLVFIPPNANEPLPKPEQIDEERIYSKNPKGIFLTPPGLDLSRLFEKTLGTSFTATDLNQIQEKLPKLLVEDLEIAEDTEIAIEQETVTVQLTNHIFNELCGETRKLKRTHQAVGCPISSAIACALAKATGKPVTIEKEEPAENGKTMEIQYRVLEG